MSGARPGLGMLALVAGLLAGRHSLLAQEAAAPPAAAPRSGLAIYLMTMGPGAEVWARFGHNALWVHDSASGQDLVYNYGAFDFDQPGFVTNFVRGRPEYRLAVWPLDGTIEAYTHERRTLEVQELALPAARKAELAWALAQNALPENASYRYDYYRDNCSTRVRDILDRVLGGALRAATAGVPGEGSYRFHTQRSLTNNALYYLGIEAAFGRRTEPTLDQWAEMFLPEMVQQRVRELRVRGDDGLEVPLVSREFTLLQFDTYHVAPAPPDWSLPLLGVGLAVAALIGLGSLGGAVGVVGRVVLGAWAIIAGAGGLLLVFLWCCTDHAMASANANVLLLSPLALALPALLRRGRHPVATALAIAVAVSALVGGLLALPELLQRNREIAALAVPPTLAAVAVALRFSRRRGPVPPAPPQTPAPA